MNKPVHRRILTPLSGSNHRRSTPSRQQDRTEHSQSTPPVPAWASSTVAFLSHDFPSAPAPAVAVAVATATTGSASRALAYRVVIFISGKGGSTKLGGTINAATPAMVSGVDLREEVVWRS